MLPRAEVTWTKLLTVNLLYWNQSEPLEIPCKADTALFIHLYLFTCNPHSSEWGFHVRALCYNKRFPKIIPLLETWIAHCYYRKCRRSQCSSLWPVNADLWKNQLADNSQVPQWDLWLGLPRRATLVYLSFWLLKMEEISAKKMPLKIPGRIFHFLWTHNFQPLPQRHPGTGRGREKKNKKKKLKFNKSIKYSVCFLERLLCMLIQELLLYTGITR